MPGNLHSADFGELLTKALNGIAVVSANQLALLEAHYERLLHWNARMNLTSVRSLEEAVVRHYAESIFLGQHLRFSGDPHTVLDVGSGAGFPGIPIAVLRPEWLVTLVESNQRKAVFLNEATRDLANVTVIARRAEEISGDWAWLVSRAVRPADACKLLPRLAPSIGLLIGAGDIERLPRTIIWDEAIFLPWGDRRVVMTGHVPRGT